MFGRDCGFDVGLGVAGLVGFTFVVEVGFAGLRSCDFVFAVALIWLVRFGSFGAVVACFALWFGFVSFAGVWVVTFVCVLILCLDGAGLGFWCDMYCCLVLVIILLIVCGYDV